MGTLTKCSNGVFTQHCFQLKTEKKKFFMCFGHSFTQYIFLWPENVNLRIGFRVYIFENYIVILSV